VKIALNRCCNCGALFTAATRSPHDPDRCCDCTPANLTPDGRIALFVRDCFQPRTTP